MRFIATVGASASGKSTWAAKFLAERAAAGEDWAELNKDLLRVEILSGRGVPPEGMRHAIKHAWDYDVAGPDEALLEQALRERLRQAAARGAHGAVFSNTNLDGGAKVRKLLDEHGHGSSELEIVPFRLGFEECLARDAGREFSVGEAVLLMQFGKLALLAAGFPPAPERAPSQPNAARP